MAKKAKPKESVKELRELLKKARTEKKGEAEKEPKAKKESAEPAGKGRQAEKQAEAKQPAKQKKKGKPSALLYAAVIAVIVVAAAAGLLIAIGFLPQAPGPGTGPDGNVQEKPMPGEREEALAGARDAEPERIEVVQGAESVPSELISRTEGPETEKFEDLNSLFKIVFELTDKGDVSFGEISGLGDGRITITPAGDYSVQLLGEGGEMLYELPFNAVFFIMGNPPEKIDSMKFVFVLPRKEGATSIAVTKERRILAEKEIS